MFIGIGAGLVVVVGLIFVALIVRKQKGQAELRKEGQAELQEAVFSNPLYEASQPVYEQAPYPASAVEPSNAGNCLSPTS